MLEVWVLLLVLDQIVNLTQPIIISRNSSLALPFTTWDALPPNWSHSDALLTGGSLGGALFISRSFGNTMLTNRSLVSTLPTKRSLSDALLLIGSLGKYAPSMVLISLSLLCLVFSLSSKRFSLIPRILKRFSILVYFKLRNRGQSVVIWLALIDV